MSLITKVRSLSQYRRIIGRWSDIQQFRRLKSATGGNGTPVSFRVRALRGASLYCRPGTTDPMVFWDTFWEQFHLPPRHLPAKAVILDLGANVGYTAAHLAALYPQARIIAVEMDDRNAELAERNLAAFGSRCSVIHAAIWSHDGELSYSGDGEWAYRVIEPGTAGMKPTKSVQALTISSLMRQCSLSHVDFLKMDIEGAEAQVLEHDSSWLEGVDCVTLEAHEPASVEWCVEKLSAAGLSSRPHERHRHGVLAERVS